MDTNEMLEVAQEFAELGRELHGDGDNDAALHRVVELAVKHVEGCSWASITVVRAGRGRSLASSDDVAVAIDAIQYELGEGPCMQAAEDDANYLLFDVEREPRWPRFAERAFATTPARSVLAFQLVAGESTALNLYGAEPGAFGDASIDAATIFAAHTSGLVALQEAEEHNTNLESALESSRQIGIALGVLMSHHKVTQQASFDLLRTASQNLHRKLRDVAADVVETGVLPDQPANRARLSCQ